MPHVPAVMFLFRTSSSCSTQSRRQARKTRRRLIERVIPLRDAEAHDRELRRLRIKGRDRNGSDPPFAQCPLRELEITGRQQPAEVEQLEVCALGRRQHETRAGERATQTIALRL